MNNYTKRSLKKLKRLYFRGVLINKFPFLSPFMGIEIQHGICHNVYPVSVFTFIAHIVNNEKSDYVSSNMTYPVADPDGLNPETVYKETYNLWAGEYGKNRLKFLKRMIEISEDILLKKKRV